MEDFKIKTKYKNKDDPNCEEFICKQQTLYNKYKTYISKDERMEFSENENKSKTSNSEDSKSPLQCPIGKDALGFYTWNYLHTMAAYYPELPTDNEKTSMKNLIQSFAYFYPCKVCSKDFQNDIKKNPVKVGNNKEFAVWLCERHNVVNLKLGKELFDCSYDNLKKRWKTGFDGCNKKTL